MDDLVHLAIEAIYAAAPDPDGWPHALQAIADCFDDKGSILIYGRDDDRFGVIASMSLAAMVAEYGRDWSQHDIRAIRARERGYFQTRDTITDRDVVSQEEMDSHPHYTQFLANHGLRYFAAASVSPGDGVEVALSVQRRGEKPPYTETELATLERLARHVEKSLRLSIRLIDGDLLAKGFGEALELASIGAFALDAQGLVIFANHAGQQLLGEGLQMADRRLAATHAPDRASLDVAIGGMMRGEDRDLAAGLKPVLLHRRQGRRPLAAYVLRLETAPHSPDYVLASARVVLLVSDLDRTSAIDPSLLRDLLGLTLGEARVAALISSGLSLRQIAERLGLTEQTIRGVLKRVFLKTGVSRQGELVSLLARLRLTATGPRLPKAAT